VVFSGVEKALAMPGVQVRFFGKPEVHGHRRYGVILATDENTEKAVEKAIKAFNCIKVAGDLHTK
jgi:phosphoribosylglycinamide formyltransferase 2